MSPEKERIDYLNSVGDKGYHQSPPNLRRRKYGLWHPVTHISITCDKAVNNFQPGSELNSIIGVSIDDQIGYIKSRSQSDLLGKRKHILASDGVGLAQALLAPQYWGLFLPEFPDNLAQQEATFTVTFTFEHGVTLTGSGTVRFPAK